MPPLTRALQDRYRLQQEPGPPARGAARGAGGPPAPRLVGWEGRRKCPFLSPWKRAWQSAGIVARETGAGKKARIVCPPLAADPKFDAIGQAVGPRQAIDIVALVGHEPWLGRATPRRLEPRPASSGSSTSHSSTGIHWHRALAGPGRSPHCRVGAFPAAAPLARTGRTPSPPDPEVWSCVSTILSPEKV
jgi:hypothetical protein